MYEKGLERLIVEVVEVEGDCPVFCVGDRFAIERGYQLVSEQPVCMHALQVLNAYYVALSRGIGADELGLAGSDGAAYLRCLDPVDYTGGGTVTFRVSTDGGQAVG